MWGLAVTLCMRVQGGPGSIQHSYQSAVSSISSAVASVPSIRGTASAAYAIGAVGAACAAVFDWTQLPQQFVLAGPGLTWLCRMVSATSLFAVIVLLVLKVRLQDTVYRLCMFCGSFNRPHVLTVA